MEDIKNVVNIIYYYGSITRSLIIFTLISTFWPFYRPITIIFIETDLWDQIKPNEINWDQTRSIETK